MNRYDVEITDHQSSLDIDPERLSAAAREVLLGESVERCEVSVAVVDDSAIHDLNRRHLGHDRPTDVLSFTFQHGPEYVEGEVIVSADTARRQAPRFGWSAHDELLLYVIHGMLHLTGYEDDTPQSAARMREGERRILNRLGVMPPEAVASPTRVPSRTGETSR